MHRGRQYTHNDTCLIKYEVHGVEATQIDDPLPQGNHMLPVRTGLNTKLYNYWCAVRACVRAGVRACVQPSVHVCAHVMEAVCAPGTKHHKSHGMSLYSDILVNIF